MRIRLMFIFIGKFFQVIVTTQEGVPQEIPYQHIVTTTQQVRYYYVLKKTVNYPL